MEGVVLNYLNKNGYKTTGDVFRQEAGVSSVPEMALRAQAAGDASFANLIAFYDPADNSPSRYDETYSKLRTWVDTSLDQYKNELSSVLYPIFVHCYLDLVSKGFTDEARLFLTRHKHDHAVLHASDLRGLQVITQAQHIQGHELARAFRDNKYNLRMCTYSFELLLKFLQDSKFMLLLSIVNQYLNIQVLEGLPSTNNLAMDVGALTPEAPDHVRGINVAKIEWGSLNEMQDPRIPDDDAQEPSSKRMKKEVEMSTAEKERMANTPTFDRIPLLEQPGREVEALNDLRARAVLSSSALPSVCMYTLCNTYDGVNAMAVADDASLIAAACADSTVCLWDVQNNSFADTNDAGESTGTAAHKAPSMLRLVAHSGPVYGVDFSPDQEFVLSVGEDATARLWSVEFQSNLVCYKGHNFPIWDVAFSPLGLYFATASHDRTARLWKTDSSHVLRIFAGHLSDVDSVKFHPNCNYVATGSTDKSVRLWDVQTGACVRIFTGHRDAVNTLAFSPDGRMLASGGEGNDVILWDLGTGKRIQAMEGHRAPVWGLDFSQEGSTLASGGGDCSVRMWDVRGGVDKGNDEIENAKESNLQVLYTKNSPVYSLKFSKRNLLMAAGPFQAPPSSSTS